MEKKYNKYLGVWKKHKKACMNIVDTITSQMDMKKSDFIETVGIETDEEINVVMPTLGR